MNPLKTLLLAWIEAREAHACYARHRTLSDRELRDLGLGRQDLVRVAIAAAERRGAAVEAAFEPHRPELTASLHGAIR